MTFIKTEKTADFELVRRFRINCKEVKEGFLLKTIDGFEKEGKPLLGTNGYYTKKKVSLLYNERMIGLRAQ